MGDNPRKTYKNPYTIPNMATTNSTPDSMLLLKNEGDDVPEGQFVAVLEVTTPDRNIVGRAKTSEPVDWDAGTVEWQQHIFKLLCCDSLKWQYEDMLYFIMYGDRDVKDYALSLTLLVRKDVKENPTAYNFDVNPYIETVLEAYVIGKAFPTVCDIRDFSSVCTAGEIEALRFKGSFFMFEPHGCIKKCKKAVNGVTSGLNFKIQVVHNVNTETTDAASAAIKKAAAAVVKVDHTVKVDMSDLPPLLGLVSVLAGAYMFKTDKVKAGMLVAAGFVALVAYPKLTDLANDAVKFFKPKPPGRDDTTIEMEAHSLFATITVPLFAGIQYIIYGDHAAKTTIFSALSKMEIFNRLDKATGSIYDRFMELVTATIDLAISWGATGLKLLHPYADLRDIDEKLRKYLKGLETGEMLPTHELNDTVMILLERVKVAQISTTPNTAKARYITAMLKTMNALQELLKSADMSRGQRAETKAIVFVGAAGSGKSTVLTLLLPLLTVMVAPTELRDAVAENPTMLQASVNINSNFMDTVRPWTKVIFTDEMFVSKDVAGTENKQSDLLIKMCSTSPYNIEKAAVEEKGNVWCNAALFVGCSNCTKIDKSTFPSYTDPRALTRRLVAYVPVPRRQFCQNPDEPRVEKRVLKEDKTDFPLKPYIDEWVFYPWDYSRGCVRTDSEGKDMPYLTAEQLLVSIDNTVKRSREMASIVAESAKRNAMNYAKALNKGVSFKPFIPDDVILTAESSVIYKMSEGPCDESKTDADGIVHESSGVYDEDAKVSPEDVAYVPSSDAGAEGMLGDVEPHGLIGTVAQQAVVATTLGAWWIYSQYIANTGQISGVKELADMGYYSAHICGKLLPDVEKFVTMYPNTTRVIKCMIIYCGPMSFGTMVFEGAYNSFKKVIVDAYESGLDAIDVKTLMLRLESAPDVVAREFVLNVSRPMYEEISSPLEFLVDFAKRHWLAIGISMTALMFPIYVKLQEVTTASEIVEATAKITDSTVAAAINKDEESGEDEEEHGEYDHRNIQRKKAFRRYVKKVVKKAAVKKPVVGAVEEHMAGDVDISKIVSDISKSIFSIAYKGCDSMGTVLAISGRYILMNDHFWVDMCARDPTDVVQLTCPARKTQDTSINEIKFVRHVKRDVAEGRHCDLVIVQLPVYFPLFKSITSSIISRSDEVMSRNMVNTWTPLPANKNRSVPIITAHQAEVMRGSRIVSGVKGDYYVSEVLSVPCVSKPGDCGTPTYVNTPTGMKLAAILSFGNASTHFISQCIFKEDFDDLGKEKEYYTVPDAYIEDVEAHCLPIAPTMLVKKAWLGKKSHSKSELCHTPLAGAMDDIFGPLNMLPARMSAIRVGEEVVVPLTKATSVYCNNGKHVPTDKLYCIADHLIAFYARNGVRSVRSNYNLDTHLDASIEEVVYGVAGLFHAMPSDTAVGPSLEDEVPTTWNGSKKKYYFGESRSLKGPGWNELLGSIKRAVEAMKDSNVRIITRLELKDELLSKEKVAVGKTRAYFVAPMEFQILIRLTYINIMSAFTSAGLSAGIAVGMNPITSWPVLATALLSKPNIIDADYAGFDGSISAQMITVVFYILERLDPQSDYLHSLIRGCIRDNVAHSWVIVSSHVFEMFGNNSGNGLTIFINCIVNHLVITYCATVYNMVGNSVDDNGRPFDLSEYEVSLDDFDVKGTMEDMYFNSMGDDLIASFSGSLADFDTAHFARLASVMGFNVTNGDKSDPYTNPKKNVKLTELTYLKRGFVQDHYKGWSCPLAIKSIQKQLEWSSVRIMNGNPEVLKLTYQEAFMELSLHGETTYNSVVDRVISVLQRRGCSELIPDNTKYSNVSDVLRGRQGAVLFGMFPHMDSSATTSLIGKDDSAKLVKSAIPLVDPYPVVGTTIEEFLAKPWLVYTSTWTTSDAVGDTILPLTAGVASDGLLLLNPLWVTKWNAYSLVRADITYTLQVNTTPFHSGEVLMHFLPMEQAQTAYSGDYVAMHNWNITTKSMQPSVVYNARDTAASLTIPYVAPTDYYALTPTGSVTALPTYSRGSLYLSVQVPLGIGATGSSTVTWALYVSFSNVELVGPLVPQMLSTKAKKKPKLVKKKNVEVTELEASTKGTISKALDSAASIASALTAVPFLAPLTGPTEWVLRGASGIASFFGYSKPLSNVGVEISSLQVNRYMATSDGVDTAYPLALIADNTVRKLDTKSIETVDEMSFNFLKGRSALINTYTWQVAEPLGDRVPLAFVGPALNTQGDLLVGPSNLFVTKNKTVAPLTVTTRSGPPVWYLSPMFAAWRGGIIFTLRFVKTDYHSGRVQVTFTPRPDGNVPTTTTAQYASRTIVDIKDTTEVEFLAPYLLPTPYADVGAYSGTFSVQVLTELRAPETCAQEISILLYARAAPDFEFQIPGSRAATTCLYPFSPQMDDGKPVTTAVTSSMEVPGDMMAPATLGFTHSEESIGESFSSIRQLLLRYNTVYSRLSVGSSARNLSIWPYFVSVGKLTTTGIVTPNYGGDVHSYLAAMYVFQRGGMRVCMPSAPSSIMSAMTTPVAVIPGRTCVDATTIVRNGIFNATLQDIDWRTASTEMQPVGSVFMATSSSATQPWATRVPYYCRTSCSMVIPQVVNAIPVVGGVIESSLPYGSVTYSNLGASNPPILRAIDEDFQLSYFIGCPPVVFGTAT